ncbi:cysteine-rich with EGF-like domain 1 [Paramuricea clavata]|uniref:Cysteine-rich with EGF-like domain 1 n=2 Tax=Paramuricea clavata TaxID=317549 RepID=A0A7D9JRC7_PARCT|nr:cysteine-rich with EGF-like domain 1 [Paramuricea clavata]
MHLIFVFLVMLSTSLCAKEKCETCKDIVTKFKEGMERTSRHNFGGGNTDWEETRLGTWADSETRLIDIIEGLCSATECHSMVEEHEEDIENWWFKQKSNGVELETWLCIDTIQVCCPSGKFGRSCEECPGGAETPCSKHGKCKGNGTRTGTGECECDDGYTSKSCNECDEGFYQDKNNTSELNCLGKLK